MKSGPEAPERIEESSVILATQALRSLYTLVALCNLENLQNIFHSLGKVLWGKVPSLNEYHALDDYFIVIVGGIFSWLFGIHFDLGTKSSINFAVGTGLQHMKLHDNGIFGNNLLLTPGEFFDFCLDLDPNFVKAIRTTLLSWTLSVAIFGVWYFCGVCKRKVLGWWNKKIGPCRFCGATRLKNHHRKTTGRATIRVIGFLWLTISAHAVDAAKSRPNEEQQFVSTESPSGLRNVYDGGGGNETICRHNATHECIVCWYDDRINAHECTSNGPDVLPRSQAQPICEQQELIEGNESATGGRCTLVETQNFDADNIVGINFPSCIPITFAEEEDCTDHFSLMHVTNTRENRDDSPDQSENSESESVRSRTARQPGSGSEQSSDEEVDALVVFGLEMEHELIPLPENTIPDDFRISVAEHFDIELDSESGRSLSVHLIRPKPPDLAQCVTPVVVLFRHQLSTDSAVVLIDIELHPNRIAQCHDSTQDVTFSREVWRVPASSNRATFLHAIGVSELCLDPYLPCVTYFGMQMWPSGNVLPFPILDGLYLQVKIPVPEPKMSLFLYREYARKGIRLGKMVETWTQEMQRNRNRRTVDTESDDEALVRAARQAETAEENDFNSLLAAPERMNPRPVLAMEMHTILIYSRILGNHPVQINPAIPSNHFRSVIGDSMDITRYTRTWDNFMIFKVVPPPHGVAHLFQDPYILALPEEIAPENSFVLVDIVYQTDEDLCMQPSETVRKVCRVATKLTRTMFLQGAAVYELCILSGNDKCTVTIADAVWHPWEMVSRYVHDGLFLTIQVPIEFPQVPLEQQIEAANQGMTAQQMIHRWSGSDALNLLQYGISLELDDTTDSISLMQASTIRSQCDCLHLPDPRMEWDWQETQTMYRHGVIWTQVWFAPLIPGMLHTNVGLFNWNVRSCLRCLLEARPDIPIWTGAVGPYTIRPQPGNVGIANAHQMILLQGPIPSDLLVIFVHYFRNEQLMRGVLLLPHVSNIVSMESLFDAASRMHLCRTRAWCRVKVGEFIIWWPDRFRADQVMFVQMEEIDPPVPESSTTSASNPRTDFSVTTETTASDEWSTSAQCEGESTILMQLSPNILQRNQLKMAHLPVMGSYSIGIQVLDQDFLTGIFFRDPMTGLSPPGNPSLAQDTKGTGPDDNRTISLAILLGIPTPMREAIRDGKRPCDMNNDNEQCDAKDARASETSIHGSIPLSLERALGHEPNHRAFDLPNFASLLDQMMRRPTPKMPRWKDIHDVMPEDLRPFFLELDLPDKIEQIWIYSDGSYREDERSDHSASWAFVVLVPSSLGLHLLDYGYGPVPIAHDEQGWTGATQANSRTAELEALIHVCEWIMHSSRAVPHTVYYDAYSAGMVANGQWQIRDDDMQALLLRNLAITADYFISKENPIQWAHCKSHTGIFGNELADCFATMARKTESSCGAHGHIDYMPYIVGPAPMISWFWLWSSGLHNPSDFPFDEGGNFAVTTPMQVVTLEKKIMSHKTITVQQQTVPKKSSLLFATHNVGSLQTQKTGFGANIPQYIREQFEAHGVQILFLQETRARTTGVIESSTHVRLICAGVQGTGGTEIWLLKVCPHTGRPLFDTRKLVVLFEHPEILMIRTLFDGLPLLLLSAHAPHTGRKDEEVRSFWQTLTAIVSKYANDSDSLFIGIDANAHFQFESPPHIGAHGLEKNETVGSQCFRDFLQKFDLFLPSTFDAFHSGPTWTWFHPGNGTRARCDYMVVSGKWRQHALQTWSPESIDIGRVAFDHNPLFLALEIYEARIKHRSARHAFDRMALAKAEPEQLSQIFEAMPTIPWACGVDEHSVLASEAIHKQLVLSFPAKQNRPRRSYITDDTWAIRFDRLKLMRTIKHEHGLLDLETLRAAFEYWWQQETWASTLIFGSVFKHLATIYHAHRQLVSTTKQLRRALRQDRIKFLTEIAIQAEQMPASDFFRSMKQVGVVSRGKSKGIKPLPILKNQHGEVLVNWDDIANRWREHFAAQEDGIETTLQNLVAAGELAEQCHDQLNWTEVPTLLELEEQFRKTASLKTVFDDMVPGELLHRAPALAARFFYPLFLKAVYINREPLMYKGALLVPAYKQKGPVDECESYWSLAVSSTVGKSFHAVYRKRIVSMLGEHALPFQIGGRPGKSIAQASQVLIASHKHLQKSGWSSSILFIDVQQAFYRLLRQHVTNVQDHRSYQALFESLKLPQDAYSEFCALLDDGDGLSHFQLPEAYKQIFGEFYRATWFVVPGSEVLTATRRGSRPGDSLADLAFLIAMAHTLRRCYTEVEGLQKHRWYWNGKQEPIATTERNKEVGLICPIWADDFAMLLFHPCAEDLVSLTTQVAGLILDAFIVAGMQPNLRKGKTEILFDLRGTGSQKLKRKLREQELLFTTESRFEPQPVHIVGKYKLPWHMVDC